MKRAVSVVALFVELVVPGYAMLMAFLLTVWIETDSFANRATEIDWWIQGGKRLFVVAVAAAIFATILIPANKVFFRRLGFENQRFALYSAGAAFLLIVAAGITGAVNFAITKPFIQGRSSDRLVRTPGQRIVLPEIIVTGAAHPERWADKGT